MEKNQIFVSPMTRIDCTRCNVPVNVGMPYAGSVIKVICHICKKSDRLEIHKPTNHVSKEQTT